MPTVASELLSVAVVTSFPMTIDDTEPLQCFNISEGPKQPDCHMPTDETESLRVAEVFSSEVPLQPDFPIATTAIEPLLAAAAAAAAAARLPYAHVRASASRWNPCE